MTGNTLVKFGFIYIGYTSSMKSGLALLKRLGYNAYAKGRGLFHLVNDCENGKNLIGVDVSPKREQDNEIFTLLSDCLRKVPTFQI